MPTMPLYSSTPPRVIATTAATLDNLSVMFINLLSSASHDAPMNAVYDPMASIVPSRKKTRNDTPDKRLGRVRAGRTTRRASG